MPTLAELVEDKLKELAEAEASVLRLKAELGDAKRLLLGDVGVALVGVQAAINPAMSSTALAQAVLRTAGNPMHLNAIVSAIERDHHYRVRAPTLVSNISRLIQNHKIFVRVEPNVFGLREWDDRAEEERESERLFGEVGAD